ncbi:Hypothetical protein AA314_10007 [Archangium gephyra]|uniref:Tox-PAAR-like domain-containing protein n=1 Tax=Archangium gephyra TaxID=48 RepID=A0AAC8QIV5_9BACT|nr:Hypothetical protein AA314_10007 [Archangium gephyra]
MPTPFVNTAQDSMLAKGSKKTEIEGNPVVLSSSELSTSSGDEPGTAGGLISSKFKGKLTWSGSSTDVKIEGKGVVRFLDPTLHNGNTFNTSFVSKGGTGLAYGDDAKCRRIIDKKPCDKPVEKHRVHETQEVQGHVDMVFLELAKLLKEQKPLIEEYKKLREERKAVDEDQKRVAEAVYQSEGRAGKLAEKKLLQAQVKGAQDRQPLQERITQLENEINAIEKAADRKNEENKEVYNELTRKMDEINGKLDPIHVLHMDRKEKTYVKGYMVGACICNCVRQPKMLAACSGKPTHGFKNAVNATRLFTLVDTIDMDDSLKEGLEEVKKKKKRDGWECAAPKLLQAGGAGHKIKAMSERWYSPVQTDYTVTIDKVTRMDGDELISEKAEKFSHGESVPSCDACQALTPEISCKQSEACPS